jgi:hypothetical protein
MIKRVNFTGRRRIPRNRVDIAVYDGQPRTFDASIDLSGLSLLSQAVVNLEATCAGSTMVERFEFGDVSNVSPPRNRKIAELEGENLFFTLKIVDRSEQFGRIVGIAEHIRPERAGKQTVTGRRGILPIEPSDLGQQLWQLEFREHDVFLLVNKDAPGLIDRVHSDPLFYAAVYPAIVRRVLKEAIAQNVEPDEQDDRWPVMWLRFGKNLHPEKEDPPRSDDPEEDVDNWVEQIVDNFCNSHSLRDKYVSATGDNGAGL